MSDSTGIARDFKGIGRFKVFSLNFNQVEYRNEVKPTTSIFNTTPTIMWSTRYLTVNKARSTATKAPAIGAPTSPR